MKWYIQAPWRIWSIQKNFVDVWVWKKRARTHTIRDVVWSNVMLRMYHSFFVVSIPFQAIAYLYVFQMKVDIFRSAIGGAAVGFNLTWSVAAVFFSPSYFSDHFCWCLFFKTNHIHNIDAKITKFRSFGSHFSFIFFCSLHLFELSVDLFKCIIFFVFQCIVYLHFLFIWQKNPKKKKNYRNKLNK